MHTHPLEARIAHLEGAFDQTNERLGSMDRRLNWLTGIVVGTWATTMLTILFHH